MKNFIYFNYGFYPKIIYKRNNEEFFFINDEKIYIKRFRDDIKKLEEIYNISNRLYNQKILVNTLIHNKQKQYYTKRDNENIILLRVNEIEIDKIELKDIEKYNVEINSLEEFDLIEYYKNKIDELELRMIEFNKEYKIIQESINYFIGMGENAIQLLSNYYDKGKNNHLSHNIKLKDYSIKELNNPLNIIKTNKYYNISNYIKYKFYNYELDYDELYSILKECNEYEGIIFFTSIMFPKEYFEIVEEIINETTEEKEINNIIKRIDEYSYLINFCRKCLIYIEDIKLINWLDK